MSTLIIFEKIKKNNEYNSEYWSARQLAKVLEYSEYRHFLPVVKKAKESCKNAGQSIKNHFEDSLDMINIGKNASREVKSQDYSMKKVIHITLTTGHMIA